MSVKQRLNKLGATPGKLVLIGVLALVLIIVMVNQLSQSAPENPSQGLGTSSQKQGSAEQDRVIGSKEKNKLTQWPEIELAETLASNPFEPPTWAVEKEPAAIVAEESTSDLAELQEQGASIVVISNGVKSATIGEQRVYIGDILEGYQVTDITTQGIVLDKLHSQ